MKGSGPWFCSKIGFAVREHLSICTNATGSNNFAHPSIPPTKTSSQVWFAFEILAALQRQNHPHPRPGGGGGWLMRGEGFTLWHGPTPKRGKHCMRPLCNACPIPHGVPKPTRYLFCPFWNCSTGPHPGAGTGRSLLSSTHICSIRSPLHAQCGSIRSPLHTHSAKQY